jgi:hypothetical protein
MARAERRVRIVVNVTLDESDPCPVAVGQGQGLILATWLAGAEVEVTDVGSTLGQGERERGPFQEQLERAIGGLMAHLGREPWMMSSIGAPRRGTRERDLHFENVGRLNGLAEAHGLLTGAARSSAKHCGLARWKEEHAEAAHPAATGDGRFPGPPAIHPGTRA